MVVGPSATTSLRAYSGYYFTCDESAASLLSIALRGKNAPLNILAIALEGQRKSEGDFGFYADTAAASKLFTAVVSSV